MKVEFGCLGSPPHILKRGTGPPATADGTDFITPRAGARRIDFINQLEVLEFFAHAQRAHAHFSLVFTDVIDYSDRTERKQAHPVPNFQIALGPANILPGRARDALWTRLCYVGLSRKITDNLAIANYPNAAKL